ncbi:MAG: PEP-CTERM sorting domain-containing protein, partial [Bacteroidetes bacterium]
MKKITVLFLGFIISSVSYAQLITENFDDITTLPGDGWSQINVSETTGLSDWFQGSPASFNAYSGATDSYIGANFNNTDTGTISNWLITPVVNVENGDVITFYTRTITAPFFADRLQVRLSDTGGSSVDPTSFSDVGSYTELLLDINPTLVAANYPDTWTLQTINIAGLTGATDVRIAFRYFVADAGPAGTNSDYIGIDDVVVTSTLGINDFEKNELS